MSRRALFFLSIIIIMIGVCGIYLQGKKSPPVVASAPAEKAIEKYHTITIAEAVRDLHQYELLRPDDFKMRVIQASVDSNNPCDISSRFHGDIRGAVMKNNVAQGSCLPSASFLLPGDEKFPGALLRADEMPYAFPITPANDYLLSVLNGGDTISLYIRVVEIDKANKSNVSLGGDDVGSAGGSNKKYVSMRVLKGVTVLESKRFGNGAKDKKERPVSGYGINELKGEIILRMTKRDLARLITIEKTGQLFLLPEGDRNGDDISKISMDDVLPQFRTIQELRGGK